VNDIPVHVVERIVLAKSLFYAGKAACDVKWDRFSFTRGILMLHDAAECALGAAANNLQARLSADGKENFLDYVTNIEKKAPGKGIEKYRRMLGSFNTLRVIAKHKGIITTREGNEHFVGEIRDFLTMLCHTYLALDFETISLKTLIRDDAVRGHVALAEDCIEKGEIRKALETLALAMYYLVEHKVQIDTGFPSTAFSDEWKQSMEHYHHHTVYLLQNGVDPYLYFQRFKPLTPRVMLNDDRSACTFHWERPYGHEANWTKANAQFCFDFCVETALKMQKDLSDVDRLIPYDEVYEDVIEALEDGVEITIFSKDSKPHPLGNYVVARLTKGQTIVGEAINQATSKEELFVVSKDLKRDTLLGTSGLGFGYVSKSKVKVKSHKKQPPPNLETSS
jgi:hypothetical protein